MKVSELVAVYDKDAPIRVICRDGSISSDSVYHPALLKTIKPNSKYHPFNRDIARMEVVDNMLVINCKEVEYGA